MKRDNRQQGIALMSVIILVFAIVIVILEFTHNAQVQLILAKNLIDEHLALYAEETAILKMEEFLWQDVTPPPINPNAFIDEEDLQLLEDQKKTDSYHDFWAKEDRLEQIGELWVRTRVQDEERKFNVNFLVDAKTGTKDPLRVELFEKILKSCGVKTVDISAITEEFIDYVDKDTKGRYEKKSRNGPMGILSEALGMENMSLSLFRGYLFPEGELPVMDEEEAFHHSVDLDNETDTTAASPFAAETEIAHPDDWEDLGIRPGLKHVLTVHGSGAINVNTAPLPILEALFDDRETALEFIKLRRKGPIKSMNEINAIAGGNKIVRFQKLIGFTSKFFRVNLSFRRANHQVNKFCIMQRDQGKVITQFRARTI